MNQYEKDLLLADIDAGLVLLDAKRPSQGTVNRAATLFKRVKVACQTIPVTPIDEFDPDPPPPVIIDPEPPDPDPGTDPGGPDPTLTTTIYSSQGDFSSVQGHRGWSYLEGDGTAMIFDAGAGRWSGTESAQWLWNVGAHSGPTESVIRRWTAPAVGTFTITGVVRFIPDPQNVIADEADIPFAIKKNGTTIYSNTLAEDDTTGFNITGVTGSVVFGDTLDFVIGPPTSGTQHDLINTEFSIAHTTQNSSGTGNPTQTSLPFLLNTTTPNTGILSLNMNKPANAESCTLTITGVNLAAAYGFLYFNGTSNRVTLWQTAPGNANISATVQLVVPVAYVFNGQNTLRFTHESGAGYTVTACTAAFTTPIDPEPPATQTSLPFILNGNILPEDGLLTITLNKPVNVTSTCTVSVTGTDLAEADGTMAVNGTTNSMTIWPVNSANNGAVRTVNLTVNSSWFINGTNSIRFTHTSGDGFIVSAVSVQFTTIPDPQPPDGTGWPNQPGGMTLLSDFGFNTGSGNGWIGEGNFSIISDSTAPFSGPSVARYSYPIGHPAGFGAAHHFYSFGGTCREAYIGFWWKVNAGWQQETNSGVSKIFFWLGNGEDAYIGMRGGSQPYRIYTCYENQNTVSNAHIGDGGAVGTRNFDPNVGSVPIVTGNWYRIEWYYRWSTGNTSQNGIFRWWVNGTMVGNYTTINMNQSTLMLEAKISPTWGGANNTKTQNDFMYFDHIRLTRN